MADDESDRERRRWDLSDRLLEFSARIIRLTEALPTSRSGNHVAGQLLRCGTSPYPNHGEAQAAESQRDFIHKMSVCLKEPREAERWLKLIVRVPLVKQPELLADLLDETNQLVRIFVASLATAGKKAPPSAEDRMSSSASSPFEVESSKFEV